MKWKASKISPIWITENHWNILLQYWEKEDVKKISKSISKIGCQVQTIMGHPCIQEDENHWKNILMNMSVLKCLIVF